GGPASGQLLLVRQIQTLLCCMLEQAPHTYLAHLLVDFVVAVSLVPHRAMPQMLRMDTYLMGAPRNRTSLNQSKSFVIGQYGELGKAWLTGRVHFNDPL